MRVAFPTNNQKTVANHIGLAKGFLIIDTNTGEKYYIDNPVLKKINEEHIDLKELPEGQRGLGTGRILPALLKEAGVDVLVARDFGEGMIRNLEFEGIRPLLTEEKDIQAVLNDIDSLKEPEIEEDYYPRGVGYSRRYAYGFGYGRGYGRGMGFGRGFGRGQGFGYGRRGRGFGRGLGFGRRFRGDFD
ncbi:NifB/NifX family molybdenum-iron cluster-binding protein [Caminibacter pacificus]|uniref:Fe-Mo cluster-binding NifX family protein n=1 Tax=Caminibacter pacificus TaxID=1424653 RepID=A0AAJ4REC8_9BACT|nr:NifB/NifX family molybdenum-iron cluster-binding protein [Caminibacter pacificus]QCI28280.1 iron-molybdenum cofactor-binding protein [Caminibacter pacificus]ROR41006.1 putative Fe-Mo cluster-binding NifX family protein [Caminibacter pacificus]